MLSQLLRRRVSGPVRHALPTCTVQLFDNCFLPPQLQTPGGGQLYVAFAPSDPSHCCGLIESALGTTPHKVTWRHVRVLRGCFLHCASTTASDHCVSPFASCRQDTDATHESLTPPDPSALLQFVRCDLAFIHSDGNSFL